MDNNNNINNDEDRYTREDCVKPGSAEAEKGRKECEEAGIKLIKEAESFVVIGVVEEADARVGNVISLVGASPSNRTAKMIVHGFKGWLKKFKEMHHKEEKKERW